ncbi:MAG TPA: ABC transporter ATP-binding protein [Planctomycetota bacterium]|nr:ABC transporter ATP-binding protein [Planctomycetota bacterium]
MFKRILLLLIPYKWPILVGLCCLLLSIPMANYHPLIWQHIFDDVLTPAIKTGPKPEYTGQIVNWVLLMVLLHFSGTGLGMLRTWLLGVAGQRFVRDLRNKLHDKLMHQSLSYHQDHRSGDLMARVIGDVDTLQDIVINGVDNIVGTFLTFCWVAGVIIWLNWKVGLITMAPLALVAVIVWVFNKKVKGLYRRIRDRLGNISSHLQEHLSGILIIKSFAREPFKQANFEEHNESYTADTLQGVKIRTYYMPSVFMVGFFSNMIMIGVGAYYVLQGECTLGVLVAYRGYWWQLFSPVQSLAQINEMIQRANASAGRIFEVLDAPEAIADAPDAADVPHVDGTIEFTKVSFAYAPERPILKAVDLQVRPGQKIGVVGPSGAGKSTVLNLILRLYDVQEGSVTIDGRDVRTLKQKSLRAHAAMVTQEPFLFDDTVVNNILFGRLGATRDEVETAAKQANAHEFILSLQNGYDTRVGERGVRLSGGQKQRLCIARAFLANPKILLLDEATASVEPESESIIQAALERLMEGRTTVIVSHRLSLVRGCDQIVVVENGQIQERGTHEELLAHNGWYARMYALQMADPVAAVAK